MTHPTRNRFFITEFVFERMNILRQYCIDYLENNVFLNSVLDFNRFVVRFKISTIVKFYNYHAFIMYRRYVCTHDNLT